MGQKWSRLLEIVYLFPQSKNVVATPIRQCSVKLKYHNLFQSTQSLVLMLHLCD